MMDGPIVQVKQGKLRGVIENNIEGGKYFSFRGIPFAEPPVGNLRFKKPQPPKSWSGIKLAVDDSKVSAQSDELEKAIIGGDDCLYLNVATNSFTETRPVIIWIHGGSFCKSFNSFKKYGPDYLLKKNIVFVSVNYRLGILGFLNMEHEECEGNQGLQDLIAALKWIQSNINAFGGDSNNVTIFGESAGGALVHGLCISPLAKGLFNKAITQSGVLFNPWAFKVSNKEYGYSLAKELGKECSSPLEVIEFLQTISADELIEKYEATNQKELSNFILSQIPTTDNEMVNPLFPFSHSEMRKRPIVVPMIIGYNSHEGIMLLVHNFPERIKQINDKFEKMIMTYFDLNATEHVLKVIQIIREFYFGRDEITEKKIDELVQFLGDLYFVNNIHEVLDNQMQHASPTYFYKFSYRPNYPGMKQKLNIKVEGTCHGDEMGCLFYSEKKTGKLSNKNDRRTMERMTTMWTNFAKTGDPTPDIDELITTKWLPLEKRTKNCYEIGDNLTCGENADDQKWKMWNSLFECVQ
ncbi:PREDICTED: esterase FE4-like [Ceratosolen solmsi marchali]|uniref:Carboxylic ester hydrolase n=1 Tax=Ceratosolen solmsi marchali TaxID=326594 RepID=A0AAJ6YCA2_9HYME|nr:PREDICTED: esterase FE4-like [Ceratosolen solmsi marchali]